MQSLNTNEHYDQIIKEIATKHFTGQMNEINLVNELKDKIIKYAENNKSHVEEILHKIGYSIYVTCITYDGFDEVLSLFKGEPYFEFQMSEINSKCYIKICYYHHLLKTLVFERKQFIKGDYYDTIFNVMNGEFRVLDKKIELIPVMARLTSWNYTILDYKVKFIEKI